MMGSFLYMRLRKATYKEFERVSTSLDDFSSVDSSTIFMLNNVLVMELELKGNDLISFDLNPSCLYFPCTNIQPHEKCG